MFTCKLVLQLIVGNKVMRDYVNTKVPVSRHPPIVLPRMPVVRPPNLGKASAKGQTVRKFKTKSGEIHYDLRVIIDIVSGRVLSWHGNLS